MIDLNHLLFFLAVATPLAVLARAWRPIPAYRGWRVAALLVLFIATLAWIFLRNTAGYIAGGVWLALLFIPATGLRRVADLAAQQRFTSARKLATGLRMFHPSDELRHQIDFLRAMEIQPELAMHRPLPRAQDRRHHLHGAKAVMLFIALNFAAFFFEISHRNWQGYLVLHRIGALEPGAVVYNHEYWRLFTALFLHYDALHLLFNLFALYVLGPPLERAIGFLRFTICYLVAGLGSNIGVVWLAQHHFTRADQLIGASGCVMGIVGAWGAYLLWNRHEYLAKQRLANVLMIVVLQTAFDFYTPQVSMAAHLCGLITGFFVGLVLAPRKKALI